MLLTYKECIELYGSDFLLKKELNEGKLFKIKKGLYSKQKSFSELEMINIRYPRAIFTGKSAYYYYGLTDVIPDKYTLATKHSDTRINEVFIHQVFVKDDLFDLEKKSIEKDGIKISVYSLERLLVDLIRFKNKIPFDYYKEIINNYRNIVYTLDFLAIEEYASKFRTKNSIMNAIQLEVL